MKKIVINKDYGGFSLSRKAFHRLRELGCEEALKEADIGEMWSDGSGPRKSYGGAMDNSFCRDVPRDSLHLVKVVEEMGKEASGTCASLAVIEIPDDVEWQIEEYDGAEHVAETHRTWY